MGEKAVNVQCYAGYKGDERPVRLQIGGQWSEVVGIEDRWYSPGVTYFRVLVKGGDGYVLRRDDAQGVWCLAGYRSKGARCLIDTKIT